MNVEENVKLTKEKIAKLRQPGIEPGSTAWKAAMLTTIPLTLCYVRGRKSQNIFVSFDISSF